MARLLRLPTRMSRVHLTQAGECLTAIAVRNGFTDRQVILDHADNSSLKKERPDPNLLREGDRVAIPELEPGGVERGSGSKHRFVIQLPLKELRIVVRGHDGKPLKDTPYLLEIDRELRSGVTDGGGKLLEPVRMGLTRALLTIVERVLVLRFSLLGPVGSEQDEDYAGIQARLHNLGYDVGPPDSHLGLRTHAALAMFQAEHGLEVNGKPDAATRGKLKEAHGC